MTTMKESDSVRFRIPGESRFLFLVRTVVTSLARAAHLPGDEVDKVEIAVDEACTNVLDHAYRNVSPKPAIDLEIHISEGQFIVDVIDYGKPFDFKAYVPPRFPDHWMEGQTRGVGLYLIRQCMDETIYDQLPGNANRFRLIKNIATCAGPVGAVEPLETR